MLPDTVRLPATTYHPIPNIDHGKLTTVDFVVIHINDGTTIGTLDWWARPGHEADGAQLQVSKNGHRYQTAGLDRICWHCPPENHRSIGIEHEGWSHAEPAHRNDSRPHVQLHASADALAFILHACKLGRPDYGVNVFPHAHFSAGGHPNCPGPWPWDEYLDLAMKAFMTHWGRK